MNCQLNGRFIKKYVELQSADQVGVIACRQQSEGRYVADLPPKMRYARIIPRWTRGNLETYFTRFVCFSLLVNFILPSGHIYVSLS